MQPSPVATPGQADGWQSATQHGPSPLEENGSRGHGNTATAKPALGWLADHWRLNFQHARAFHGGRSRVPRKACMQHFMITRGRSAPRPLEI